MSKLHNPNFHFQYTLLDQTSLDTKKVSQVNIPIVYMNWEYLDSLRPKS